MMILRDAPLSNRGGRARRDAAPHSPDGLRAEGPPARVSSAPLAALAGGALAQQFHAWRGRSGRRHVFSVFPLEPESVPDFEDAVVIAAAVGDDGARRIVLLAETGSLPELVLCGSALARARRKGAGELHVYLLARTRSERQNLLRDLRVEPAGEPGERAVLDPELDEVLMGRADVIGIVA